MRIAVQNVIVKLKKEIANVRNIMLKLMHSIEREKLRSK